MGAEHLGAASRLIDSEQSRLRSQPNSSRRRTLSARVHWGAEPADYEAEKDREAGVGEGAEEAAAR